MTNKKAATGFWSSFPVHFKRALRVDLDPGELLPDERQAIEVDRVHGDSEAMRRLLLWRRSMLYVGFFFFVPTTVIGTIDNIVTLSDAGAQMGGLAGLKFLVVLLNIVLCVGLYVAYQRWSTWARSRKVLFWCWLLAFLGPFLIALFPVRSLFEGRANDQALMLIGALGALELVMELAPKAVSLIPGILRAALTTKVLFPRATAPGWLVMMSAPIFVLLIYIVMMMPYQIGGSALILLSLLCFITAPAFLWRVGGRLGQPMSETDAIATIKRVRMTTGGINAAGGLFLFIGLIDLMGDMQLSAFTVISLMVGIPANILVLTIVAVDGTKVALTRAHRRQIAPEFEDGLRAYHADMAAFAAAQPEEVPAPASPSA